MTRSSSSAFDLTGDATDTIKNNEPITKAKSPAKPKASKKDTDQAKKATKGPKYPGAKHRNIALTDECHTQLKIAAAIKGITMNEYVETLLRKDLGI